MSIKPQDNLNRRQFMLNSAMAIGGVALGLDTLAAHAHSLDDKPLNVGVIGTGSRGQGLIKLIQPIEGMKVCACADIIPFRLQEGLEKAEKKAKGYEDYRALLDDRHVDAVIIATPFGLHGEMALAALDAGKHVFCEKTMVRGIDHIQKTIDKAKANPQLIFQTGHQYHSSDLYRKAHHIIQSGYLGEITAFHCQWNRNGDWRRSVPDPKLERLINRRMYKEYSGGLIAELMSHQIDFINWVTGSYPAKVSGFGGIDYWKDGRETYDNIHLLMAYENGIDASFSCTTINGYGDYEIKVLGKEATMILDYNKANIYLERKKKAKLGMVDGVSGATMEAWQQGKGAPIEADGENPTAQALMTFRDAIRKGEQPESNVITGGVTAKCITIGLDAVWQEKVKHWKDYPELII